MQFTVLGSGSKGNSVYIESGNTAILLDAGFSGKQLGERARAVGKEIDKVDALLITHEHNDHICGAGVISRRLKIPIMANEGTFRQGTAKIGKPHRRIEFTTGEKMAFQDFEIRSFRTLHDTADPVGFVISDGHFTLGYCTDTGKTTHLMAARLRLCDAVILEFNHDPQLLKEGPYPLALQQRVRSSHGHLANEDAAHFLQEVMSDKLRVIVLAHLSETNNSPELAWRSAQQVTHRSLATVLLAEQGRALSPISLGKR